MDKKTVFWRLNLDKTKIAVISFCCALLVFLSGCASSDYNKAVSMFNNGDYKSAEDLFKSLGDYKDSANYLADIPYQEAMVLFNNGDYTNAERAFAILDDYKDSPKMVKECRYCYGKSLIEAGDYDKAEKIFIELGDYKDSSYIITDISNAKSYAAALYLYENGNYNAAISQFAALQDYKDSKEMIDRIKHKKAEETNSLPYFVSDLSNLLTPEQWDELESTATSISTMYGCGIYIVTLRNYKDYSPGTDDFRAFAEEFYSSNNMGMGDDHNGTLLILSMAERDYALISYGSLAHNAFTDYGTELLASVFLDNFRSNDWFGGFSDYLKGSSKLLEYAALGNPVDVYFSGSIL